MLWYASGTPRSFSVLSVKLRVMYYVYVLRSSKYKRRIYIGSTNDLKRRLFEHNKAKNLSTKYGIPWNLVYYEAFQSQKDCLKREKDLKKHGSAYGFLKRRIKNSLDNALKERGVANGRVTRRNLPLGGE